MIGRRADVQAVVWIGRVPIRHMELSLLLVPSVLGIGLHAISLKVLANDLALDQLLRPLEIPKRAHNLRISGHHIPLKIYLLGPGVILHPRRAVFLVGGIVEAALGCLGEGIFSRVAHAILFIT